MTPERGAVVADKYELVEDQSFAAPARTEVDPGTHTVQVTAPGAASVTQQVAVPEGGVTAVDVPVGQAGAPMPSPTGPAPAPGTVQPTPQSTEVGFWGSPWPAAVAYGVTVVTLTFGFIAGGTALRLTNALEDDCGGKVCPLSEQHRGDSIETWANVSNVMFVLAGTFGVAGLVLIIWRPGDTGTASVKVSPNGVAVEGTF